MQERLEIHEKRGKRLVVDFSGGNISSDSGFLLLSKMEDRIGLLSKVSSFMPDDRLPSRIKHTTYEICGLTVVLEGGYLKSEIEVELELYSTESGGEIGDKKTITYNIQKTELEESYIKYNLGDVMDISYGRKKIIWGQFAPFSPVDFVLPMRFSRGGASFSKVANRVPMNHLNISLYLTPQIKLEGYYITDLAYDDVVEETVTRQSRQFYIPEADGFGGYTYKQTQIGFNVPEGNDRIQTAYRLMFYPRWASFGFTYFEGWNTNFLEDFSSIKPFNYTASPTPDLYYQSLTGPVKTYFDAILNDNQGKLYVDGTLNFFALGFDVELTNWMINFMLFPFKPTADSKGQELQDLEKLAYPTEDDGFGNVFPSLNIAYSLDKNKKSILGLAAGIIGPGGGVALYLKGEVKESLTWLVSMESVEYFSDEAIGDYDREVYQRANKTTSGIRFAILYEF